MDNIIEEKSSTNTGDILLGYNEQNFLIEKLKTGYPRLETEELSDFEETISTSSMIDENYINESRFNLLKKQFTKNLITLITEEDFEYGIETKADILVRSQMKINSLTTKHWLNSIFVEYISDISIVIGLLRIIARIDFFIIYPEGQTMAVAALSHKNVGIQECGVRAFESWGTLVGLKILENLKVSSSWLQEYIDQVALDLKKEYDNVFANKKNR
ncbi:MAG: hypothetical protein V1872_04545 [bacterium]